MALLAAYQWTILTTANSTVPMEIVGFLRKDYAWSSNVAALFIQLEIGKALICTLIKAKCNCEFTMKTIDRSHKRIF